MRATSLVSLALAAAACGGGGGASASDAGAPDAGGRDAGLVATFPAGFQWGTANAPYQVEGGLHGTDWYAFETSCSACSHDRADDGPDFWDRYDDDFALAQAGKQNAIRIGIDWSRVFPGGMSAPADAAAVARYHDILRAARARGLRPMVTLHHFANPTWLVNGWLDPNAARLFGDFARWAAAEYGADVDWWITINEPVVLAAFGYLTGEFPPGHVADVPGALAAVDAMLAAHVRAYDAIHEADKIDADGDGKAAWVSIASHNRVWRGKVESDANDQHAAAVLRSLMNRLFFDVLVFGRRDLNYDLDFDDPGERDFTAFANHLDYLGVNYYGIALVASFGPNAPPPLVGQPLLADLGQYGLVTPVNDLGWAIYPEGFGPVLDELRQYGLPIVITENGIADSGDRQRPRYLIDHLRQLSAAIGNGIDVRGYYHWTLVDNFEWADGFCGKFGLASFDRTSPQRTRTARPSLQVFRRIIEAGGIPADLLDQYPSYPGPEMSCPRLGLD